MLEISEVVNQPLRVQLKAVLDKQADIDQQISNLEAIMSVLTQRIADLEEYMGLTNAALQALEKYIAQMEKRPGLVRADDASPLYDELRRDPRFITTIQEIAMNIAREQMQNMRVTFGGY